MPLFFRRIVNWFTSRDLGEDRVALSRAIALCLFLWGLKVYLTLWYVSVKGVAPLDETPAWTWPLLGGGDVMVCGVAAGVYFVIAQLCDLLPKAAAKVAKFIVPFAIHVCVVVFSVASLIVNQLYGWPLDNGHMRQADDLGVMGDSIKVYVNFASVTMILLGIASFVVLGPLLRRIILDKLPVMHRRLPFWTAAVAVTLILGFSWVRAFDGLYLYGIKKNALIHYAQYYEPPLEPLNAPVELAALQKSVGAFDADMSNFASKRPDVPPMIPTGVDLHGKAARMNVVFILMESTSRQYIDPITTPNVVKLAEHAVNFENHFTVYSETQKAVYALLYSDYLVNLGGPPRTLYNGVLPQPSLPESIKHAGYDTALFHSGYLAYSDLRFWWDHKGFDTLAGAMELRKSERDIGWMWGLYEERTVDAMTQWIGEHHSNRDRPFFALYSTMFPHHPYHCPLPDDQKPFPEDSWKNRYRNALHYADKAVGQLVDNLTKLNAIDDTIIVVVGDHGESVEKDMFGHGMALTYDEIRTPMIIANPKLFPTRVTVNSKLFSSHLDVAPTLLGLLNVEAPAEWLGRDLSMPEAPARLSYVTVDQAKLTAVVDNGRLFELDAKGGERPMQAFNLKPDRFAPLDLTAELVNAYRPSLEHFSDWVRFRHFRRALEPATAVAADSTRLQTGAENR